MRRPLGALVLALLVCGCETTGDPSKGGIFWSPTKARARQDALAQQNEANRQQALQEQQATADILSEQAALTSDVNRLQSQLAIRTQENEQLDKKLRALLRVKKLKDAELQRLNRELAENEQARKTWRTAPAAVATVNQVERRNERLRQEILLLGGD